MTNFNDLQEGRISAATLYPELLIQKGDILGITITSRNPEASRIFNAPVLTPEGSNATQAGYLVTNEGTVQLPVLGLIKAEGISQKLLADQIQTAIVDKKLLVDPIVTIRHLNFRVTVLGEVGRPGMVTVPNERITLLEALGMAGDLTIYAKRDNVLLIRDESGERMVKRLDLTNKEFLASPYYHLKPNDVVYVEPNKSKVAGAGRATTLLPVIFGGLSFIVIVADRLFR